MRWIIFFTLSLSIAVQPACLEKDMSQKNMSSKNNVPGIEGVVRHESDVSTIPNMAYKNGIVLAFSRSTWQLLVTELNLNQTLRSQFNLSRNDYESRLSGAVSLSIDGAYKLELSPGDYVVCVGNLGSTPADQVKYPVAINGCFETFIPDFRLEVDIYYGIGGIRAAKIGS